MGADVDEVDSESVDTDEEWPEENIINNLMALEREYFGDDEPIFPKAHKAQVKAPAKQGRSRPKPASPTQLKAQASQTTLDKAKAKKVKKCGECGTTDPDAFYDYFNNICRECYRKQQYEKRAERRRSAGMRVKSTDKTSVDRCAAEIKAAGPDGIFQRDLRDKLGLGKESCKVAVKELIDGGKVVHTGEQSRNGSPKLVWKAPTEPHAPTEAKGLAPRPRILQKNVPHKH